MLSSGSLETGTALRIHFPPPPSPVSADPPPESGHDSQAHPVLDFDTDADGNVEYEYASYFVEWQTVGRLTLDPYPYMRGRESQLRILGGTVLAPADVSGTGVLQVWPYDQHKLPGYYVYRPTIKSVRAYPADQRFEPCASRMRAAISNRFSTKGDKAPDAVLRDAASTEVRLSELWREHPLVLVFLRHFG